MDENTILGLVKDFLIYSLKAIDGNNVELVNKLDSIIHRKILNDLKYSYDSYNFEKSDYGKETYLMRIKIIIKKRYVAMSNFTEEARRKFDNEGNYGSGTTIKILTE